MNPTSKAYFKVHIATILYGLTAILGDLISLNAVVLVWWRVILASIGVYIVARSLNLDFKKIKDSFWVFFFLGWLIGLHWVTFYAAIKMSNASLTLICFSTTSLFSAVLEPIMTSKEVDKTEIILGLLIIPFIYLIANDTSLEYINGIYMGLFSALLISVFGVLNKVYLKDNDATLVSGVELSSAAIILSVFVGGMYVYDTSIVLWPSHTDWVYLVILSFLCTTFAFIITTQALKKISAFATALIINLEPVYGIFLAFLILGDGADLDRTFYMAAAAIGLIVFIFPFLSKRKRMN